MKVSLRLFNDDELRPLMYHADIDRHEQLLYSSPEVLQVLAETAQIMQAEGLIGKYLSTPSRTA